MRYYLSILVLIFTKQIAFSQTERLDSITQAYYQNIGIEIDSCSDSQLLDFSCLWLETPYLYAGTSYEGIDCSGFTKALYFEVYNTELTGSSSSLFQSCEAVSDSLLTPGDLVFFKIYSNKISHVGVYLGNDQFIHASTKLGVTISDLHEAYYAKRFYSGGRIVASSITE